MIDSQLQQPSNPQPSTIRRKPSRYERRAFRHNLDPKNNDGSFKNSRTRPMMPVWNDQAIYIPRRKKLKGYQKNAKRA